MSGRSFGPRDNGCVESAGSRPRLPSHWAGVAAKLPPALENLAGPVAGVVELPLDLAWSGDRRFDLADPGQRYLCHMTVLTSAVTREHYTSWLNASLLRGEWSRLRLPRLPRPLREIWGAGDESAMLDGDHRPTGQLAWHRPAARRRLQLYIMRIIGAQGRGTLVPPGQMCPVSWKLANLTHLGERLGEEEARSPRT